MSNLMWRERQTCKIREVCVRLEGKERKKKCEESNMKRENEREDRGKEK